MGGQNKEPESLTSELNTKESLNKENYEAFDNAAKTNEPPTKLICGDQHRPMTVQLEVINNHKS